MLTALKKELNKTYTENGAVTHAGSMSDCLDFFGTCGALRYAGEDEIMNRFYRAYAENPDAAMKILFFARDVRGGLGERRVFRTCISRLADSHPESVRKNLPLFAEYGRFDDLFAVFGTVCEEEAVRIISSQLEEDIRWINEKGKRTGVNDIDGEEGLRERRAEGERDKERKAGGVSLLSKWMPSVNASDGQARALAKKLAGELGMSMAQYRKTLSALRREVRIVENCLREKDYTFDYSAVPSRAALKYRAAFMRNDGKRYREFLDKAQKGQVKMHTDTLMPYELIQPYLKEEGPLGWAGADGCFVNDLSEDERASLNAMWNALPDYTCGQDAIAVVDTSASMYCCDNPVPASVALSLGLYFSERNRGRFRNHFIEFSSRPQLIEIKGETFADRLRYIGSFCEVADTDLMAVFRLILNTAVENGMSQDDMPSVIYIISDMEFNSCVENGDVTNFEYAKRMFEDAGYRLPAVVFWNVASRNRQQPVTVDDAGVVLVSGCNPRLFSRVVSGDTDPYGFMMDVISDKRYDAVTA